ncbi:MAG TPA: NAD-dependent epimerase/dehydratase family protein, partial [Acidimicrobiales bacterium]|nr:NAD-dependent epimerase/dehydratase family protein [Acidimicrobiales bacterium]
MRKVLVTGAAGELGSRVVTLLAAADFCSEVVALDPQAGPPVAGVRWIRGDLTALPPGVDRGNLMAGVDTIVHLGWIDPDESGGDPNRSLLEAVLELATAPEVGQLVAVSSATVYGAWENNPVPLSENSVVRPNPGFVYAETKAEHERVLAEWRRGAGAGTAVGVLRPAPAVGATGASWLGAALLTAVPVRVDRTDPPSQFLDVGDLATAVVRVVELGLDGPYNVAPDGWLTGDELRALLGPRARLRIPAPIAGPVHRLLRRRRSRPLPAGLLPYTMYPW